MNNKSKNIGNETIILNLLSAVESDSNITQRSIAANLGIALGLTNSYLKRCIEKGLVKISHVPRNRYAYYLTPKGFIEKARITQDYLKTSFNFFRKIKNEFEKIFTNYDLQGGKNIILSDVSEIAEVAILSSLGMRSKVIGIIGVSKGKIAGVPIYTSVNQISNFDIIVITKDTLAKNRYKILSEIYGNKKVVLPKILENL
jgi:predicted transcriptional regulator